MSKIQTTNLKPYSNPSKIYINDNIVDEINERIILSDFIGRYVKLKQKGSEKEGLCPFHNEKTPSFSVNDSKKVYYCFGCKANGNLFTFAQSYLNLNFTESLKMFSEQLGIDYKRHKNTDKDINYRKNQHVILEKALEFITSNVPFAVSKYLEKRMIKNDVIKMYQIGFCRVNLYSFLKKNLNIDDEIMLKSGVFYKTQIGILNRFENRITFPIKDKNGKIIAFGGRAFKSNTNVKYINSSETDLFYKKNTLYGMHEAIKLKRKHLLIVEGYFDVFSITSLTTDIAAVATMGTSVSQNQIERAWEINKEPVFCFDGDEAGQKAMSLVVEKILPILKPGYSFKFLVLNKSDPDDILKKGNSINLEKAISLFEYIIYISLKDNSFNDMSPENKALTQELIKSYINMVQNHSIKSFYNDLFYKKWRAVASSLQNRKKDLIVNKNENLHVNIMFSLIKEIPVMFYEIQDKLLEIDLNIAFSILRDSIFKFFNSNDQEIYPLNKMLKKIWSDAKKSEKGELNDIEKINETKEMKNIIIEHKKIFNKKIELDLNILDYKIHLPLNIDSIIKKYNEGIISSNTLYSVYKIWKDTFNIYNSLN